MTSRERLSIGIVGAAMAIGAFALGSAPRWAVCITAALCVASMAPLVTSRRSVVSRQMLLAFLGIAVAMTALQAVPLPAGIVERLSPYKWGLVADNARAWGDAAPSWLALSYDPPQTLVELAKLSGYVAFAFTCAWLASYSTGRQLLVTIAALVGAAMALTALVHFVVGTHKLFGIYEPNFAAPRLLAPLLNPNHLAGLLALVTPLCIGLAVATPGQRRLLWIGVALGTGGVCLLTESRGGAIAVALGSFSTVTLAWLQSRRGEQSTATKIPRAVLVPAAIVMSCALALLAAFTAGGVAKQIQETSTEQLSEAQYKLAAWGDAQKLIYRHAWTGVGRGGFEPAFTKFHPSGEKVYSHVENEYLQTILDWGIPVAAAMGILLVLMVITGARRGLLGPLEAGSVGALVAVAAHNFVDFNLEFPAIALPAIAAVCVLLPARVRESRKQPRRLSLRIAGVAGGAVAVALAASPLGATARGEADELNAALAARKRDLTAEARALTRRHPSDYVSFGLAAQVMFAAGDARAARLVNRAQGMNPEHSGLHHLAAQMLISSALALEERAAKAPADQATRLRGQAAQARNQSLVEYALALRTAAQPRDVLVDLIANIPDTATAGRGLPTDPELAPEIVKQLGILHRDDLALAQLKKIHEQLPQHGDIAGLLSEVALKQGEVPLAVETGKQAYAYQAIAQNSWRYGRALSAAGRDEDALKVLTDGINLARARGTRTDTVMLMIALGDVQRRLGKLPEAEATFTSAGDIIGGDRVGQAAIHRGLAQVYDAMGYPNQAAVERRRAEGIDPTELSDAAPAAATPRDAAPGDGATGDARARDAAPRDAARPDAAPPRDGR